MNMQKGTVKWFNPTKGYGFIQPEDGSADVFVHISAVKAGKVGDLNEGDVLEFSTEQSRGKTSAVNLRRV